MIYKVFYNSANQNSGQLGAGVRRIETTGRGKVLAYGYTVDGLEAMFSDQLKSAGWQQVTVDFQQTDYFTLDGMDFNLFIAGNVSDQYTDRQHLDFVYSLFEQPRTQILGGKIFTDIYLTTGSASTNSAGTNPGSNNPNQNKSFWEQITDDLNPTKLFGTTGVTVGVMGAVLVIALILKR
jgi:hypothetical protein